MGLHLYSKRKLIAALAVLALLPLTTGGKRWIPWATAAAGGFTPPAGTLAWFKADALSLSNTDPVASWADSSGAGNNLSQATSGARPVYNTNVQNSLPGVTFDGSDDYLQTSTFTAETQPNTVMFVGKIASTAASQYYFDGRGGHRHMVYYATASGALNGYAGGFMFGTNASYGDTNAHQFTVVFDGASSAIYIDGAALGTGDVGSNDIDAITLGATGDVGGFGAVTIFEVLVRAGGRDTGTETYLKAKWGTP
jgi:hypothetical protein